jgi:hypothetical protein
VRFLDIALLRFDVNEEHSVALPCDSERAVALALAAPAAPDRLVGLLLRLRGLPSGTTVAGLFESMDFEVLARGPAEIVLGAAGRPWRPSGRLVPFADPLPGTVRIALDLRAVPAPGGGCVLSTETRVQAVDEHARRSFGRYWRLVRPLSGLIRRRWLRAVRRAAERYPVGTTSTG